MFLQSANVASFFSYEFREFSASTLEEKGEALPYRSRTQKIEEAAKHPFTSAHKGTRAANAKAEQTLLCKIKGKERSDRDNAVGPRKAPFRSNSEFNVLYLIESLHRSFQRYQLWFLCSKMM